MVSPGETKFTSEVNTRLIRYTRARLSEIEPFQGFWEERPEDNQPGERYWCVGNIDGAINFIRNMAEWTVTISLFEFDEHCHARPIMGVVHAPAMGITYMAAKGQGAIRIRRNPVGGDKREKVMPSITATLDGSVVSYGMSYVPEESKRALSAVASIAGKTGRYQASGSGFDGFVQGGRRHVRRLFRASPAQVGCSGRLGRRRRGMGGAGRLRQWNGELIHWRRENDVVASNGLIGDELQPYLQ